MEAERSEDFGLTTSRPTGRGNDAMGRMYITNWKTFYDSVMNVISTWERTGYTH